MAKNNGLQRFGCAFLKHKCSLYTVHYNMLCKVHCTLYTTLYIVHYTVHYTVHNTLHFTLYTTLYTAHQYTGRKPVHGSVCQRPSSLVDILMSLMNVIMASQIKFLQDLFVQYTEYDESFDFCKYDHLNKEYFHSLIITLVTLISWTSSYQIFPPMDQQSLPEGAQYGNNKCIYNKQCMFKANYYLRKIKFYMVNIPASVTNFTFE